MQVSLWMTQKPHCASADDLLDVVATAMEHRCFRHVPVVDAEGRLVGIVTDRDLREHKGYWSTTKVSAAISEPAIALGPDDPIESAAQILLERKIGGLPVIDGERRVIGILTTSDLLRGVLNGIGGTEGTVRIDLAFSTPEQSFAEAVRVVEKAGGMVLGLGTFDPRDNRPRRFFVRVPVGSAERAADALRAAGFSVTVTRAATAESPTSAAP